jgi:phytoene synthase
MTETTDILAELPSPSRLALVYAPATARAQVQDLLLLDARLAAIVRRSREPLLGQIQLAWWREQLQREPAARPIGQPLLAALSQWRDGGRALTVLVDGWEGLIGDESVEASAMQALAKARGESWAVLAGELQLPVVAEAERAGREWGIADLCAGLGAGPERDMARTLVLQEAWQAADLPRPLRSLAILHGLARRSKGGPLLNGPLALAAAVRIGIIGR